MNIFAAYSNSLDLPLGHYAREHAQQKIRKEYSAAHKQAEAWRKKHRSKTSFVVGNINCGWYGLDAFRALLICHVLMDSLGMRRVRKIVLQSREVQKGFVAHYQNGDRSIHATGCCVDLGTLLHELAHHVCFEEKANDGHGSNFCWAEQVLFSAMEERIFNRP